MKTLRILCPLLLLAALPLILSACKDKDEVDYENEPIGWIRLSTEQFELGPDAATLQVTVEVNNVPLRAEIYRDYVSWITSCKLVEQEQGGSSRKETYLITVEANDTYARRLGTVFFYAGSYAVNPVSKGVVIIQEPMNH